jgi:hypothetical protein
MMAIDDVQKELENDLKATGERESNDKVVLHILDEICKDRQIVKTRDDNYYVQLENPIDGNKKTYSFDESDFHDFIRVKFFEKTGKTINTFKLKDGIATFKAIIVHQENARLDIVDKLSNRIHGSINSAEILYDLATDTGEVVKITSEGWDIVHLERPVFRRSSNILPQVMPVKSQDFDNNEESIKFWRELRPNPLFSKFRDNYRLLMVYLGYSFIPQLPKPILLLRGDSEEENDGEGGSGKSTLIRYIKQIVDPSSSELSSIPKDVKDLKHLLSESLFVPLDNVTHISNDVSDTLCQAVTGGTLSNRKLYANREVNTIRYKNSVAINGINLRKIKPDLRDRAIIFDIERINDSYRRTETELDSVFEKLLPELLGRIFDVISKVIRYIRDNPHEIENIRKSDLPRMADFAMYGEIISRVMFGEENYKNAFLENYKNKTVAQNGNWGTDGNDLESHAVIQGLNKLREALEESYPLKDDDPNKEFKKLPWQGSYTDLFVVLSSIVIRNKILNATEIKDPKLFPQAPNSLSRILKTFKPVLKRIGIELYSIKSNDAKRDKSIYIEMKYQS